MKNFIEVTSNNTDENLLINISSISIVVDRVKFSTIYIGSDKYDVKQSYKEVVDRIKIAQGELNVSKPKGINVI